MCSSGQCEATASNTDGGPAYVAVERRCLPALICDEWADCAGVMGNTQDGWFVEESTRVSRGEIAGLERVATVDKIAVEAFRLYPPGVECLPHTIPPVLARLPFSCRDEAGHCKSIAAK